MTLSRVVDLTQLIRQQHTVKTKAQALNWTEVKITPLLQKSRKEEENP